MKAVRPALWIAVLLIFSIGSLAYAQSEVVIAKEAEISRLRTLLADKTDDIDLRQKLAYIYYQDKDYQEVINILEPFSDKLTRKARYLLFFGYKGKEDALNEIRMLQFLLATDKTDVRAMVYLGDAYLRQNKANDALGQFRQAVEMDPKHEEAYWGVVASYEQLKNTYELRITYHDMVNVFGKKPKFLAELCKLYSNEAFFAKATEYCNEAIMADPKNADNHVYLALALKDSGGEDRAYQILQQTSKRFPASEITQRNYASMLESRNNYVAAYKHYKMAAETNDKSGESMVGYAEAAFRLQKYDEALVAYKKACTIKRSYIAQFHKATMELMKSGLSLMQNKYAEAEQDCNN